MRSLNKILAGLGDGRHWDRRVVATLGEPELLHVLGVIEGGIRVRFGARGAHVRDVMDDFTALLSIVAQRNSARFLSEVSSRPRLAGSMVVLSAVASLRSRAASDILLRALAARDGTNRWLALRALARRREPRLAPLLADRLRDRDSLVRFAAAESLQAMGDRSALAPLKRLAASPSCPPGTRAAALKAATAIRGREKKRPPR